MMLFVGAKDRGYWLEEIHANVEIHGYTAHIASARDAMLAKPYDYIVVDMEQLLDAASDIVEDLARLQAVIAGRVIIYAPGYSPESELVQEAHRHGLDLLVLAPMLGSQKQELRQAMEGHPYNLPRVADHVDNSPAIPAGWQQEERPEVPAVDQNKEPKSVAVCGCCSRIGTTTQALQIAKYLTYQGYKACYIECNDLRYVERLATLYGAPHNQELGLVSYEGLDLYYRPSKLPEICTRGYDYLVRDFGTWQSVFGYLRADYKLVVCGSKPNEFEPLGQVLQQTILYDEIWYIFSFSAEEERAELLDMMDDRANRTIFAPYAPDPFVFLADGAKAYQPIFQLPMSSKATRHKKFVFGRSRRRK